MKNRYNNILEAQNKKIIELSPANQTLRVVTAFEFNKVYKDNYRVLEIGCGEGDSAEYILQNENVKMDLLDVSIEMVEKSKKALKKYKDQTSYICEDALSYLERSESYDVIFSSWTIHNFIWKDKIALFNAVYKKLKKGGYMIMMDKVYPEEGKKELLDLQLKRYRCISKDVAKSITDHEKQDYTPEYRMDEVKIISKLKSIGFKNIKIMDRVERDVILIARK